MINKESIFFTILVSFVISILLVIASFIIIFTNSYKDQEEQIFDRYIPLFRMINKVKFNFDNKFISNLEQMNYKLYSQKKDIENILKYQNIEIYAERINLKNGDIFRILKKNTDYYLYMKLKNSEILIEDKNGFNNSGQIYIVFVFSILLLTIIILYCISLKKLLPLKTLQEKVKSLGDENFDFDYSLIDGKDEVSMLAKEFKKTGLKLKNYKESRNIFIRNIMHELKTPITKGKFLTQLEQNEQNNEKIKSVFNRLESLINEFATIEELITSSQNIKTKTYFLDDVIDNAKDILMLEDEDEKVIKKFENNLKLNINFKLFSIAIKNLIDNALKYSTNEKVVIKTENNCIIFENTGKKLEESLEKYFEPFFSGENKMKNSFGLGLYIVNSIFKANNYILDYKYEDNLNKFIVKQKDN